MTRPLVDSPRPQRPPLAHDDPRHGTAAGYTAHRRSSTPICDPCQLAWRRYEKRRIMAGPQTVSSLGARRRIEALHTLGWSQGEVALACGYKERTALKAVMVKPTITKNTAALVDRAYRKLRNTAGGGHRAGWWRRQAAERGYAPPHAWLDIDDENETPDPGYREQNPWQHAQRPDIDPVVVERILAGDFTIASATSKAEKVAVVAAWAESGRALKQLEDGTGWAVHRYLREARSEVAS